MPATEYTVYVSNTALMAEIEEYCKANDLSASEAFRSALKREIRGNDE